MQQVFLGDKFGNDQQWENMLLSSMNSVKLPIEAVITNKISTIEEMSQLKIGDTIIMEHPKDKDITVRSGSVELFTGKIGKVDNKVAISLKKIID
jgi:flagellar motor switch protein FliM